jgi:hypothetical protein
MANFMNIVPSEITRLIANELDLKSFPSFLATCKYAYDNTNCIFDNKVFDKTETVITEIIKSIEDYDATLQKPLEGYKALQSISKAIFNELLNCDDENDRFYLSELLEQATYIITQKMDCTEYDVHNVFEKIINNIIIEDDFEKAVSKSIHDCLFNDRKYNVIFELLGNNQETHYWLSLNLTVKEDLSVYLKVKIEDDDNEVSTCDNMYIDEVNMYIPDAEINCDGELEFTGTSENIHGLTRYICKVFGKGLFTETLSKEGIYIEICNIFNQPFASCEFYKKAVKDLSYTKDASQRILETI